MSADATILQHLDQSVTSSAVLRADMLRLPEDQDSISYAGRVEKKARVK
jgi:hypothetical protein